MLISTRLKYITVEESVRENNIHKCFPYSIQKTIFNIQSV